MGGIAEKIALRGDIEVSTSLTAVRVQGITKRYDKVLAVDNVTFEVEQGELLTLLGPSGCGKTTTMRAIAGLEKIQGGEIYLGERLVSSVSREVHITPEKRDVGMVFQSYAIWPHMTVFENVAYPLRYRKVEKSEMRRRVREVLQLVEMDAFEDRLATRLSGGQQQRVALARAIVMQPSVLLLDEPLSNLDAKLRGQMRTEIKRLQQRTGLTTIYVTHDQAEAMSLSDRLIVMNRGVIEQVGSPGEVYERPQSEFVADFVGAINFIRGEIVDANPSQSMVYVSTGSERLACTVDGNRCPASGERVLLVIRPEKITVTAPDIHPQGRVEEETFLVNKVNAQVEMNTYYGDHRELNVTTKDFSLKVLTPNSVTAQRGRSVGIEFSPDDVQLLI